MTLTITPRDVRPSPLSDAKRAARQGLRLFIVERSTRNAVVREVRP